MATRANIVLIHSPTLVCYLFARLASFWPPLERRYSAPRKRGLFSPFTSTRTISFRRTMRSTPRAGVYALIDRAYCKDKRSAKLTRAQPRAHLVASIRCHSINGILINKNKKYPPSATVSRFVSVSSLPHSSRPLRTIRGGDQLHWYNSPIAPRVRRMGWFRQRSRRPLRSAATTLTTATGAVRTTTMRGGGKGGVTHFRCLP